MKQFQLLACILSLFATQTWSALAANEPAPLRVEKATEQADWVRLDPGSRPAYVGIQGGTAPVSVLRATDGSLFVFTGNTGNDFTQVLHTDGSRNGTLLSSDANTSAASYSTHNDLQPFGLSNPKDMRLGAPPVVPRQELDNAASFKPLRLQSYKKLLDHSGSL